MKNPALFFGGIALAIVSLALAIYYVVPGYPHILVSDDTGYPTHPTHFVLFLALVIIGVIAALVARPRSSAGSNSGSI